MLDMFEKLKGLVKPPKKKRLSELKPDLKVAVCALLLEVASSDLNIDSSEMVALVDILKTQYGLGAQEVEDLVEMASEEREMVPDVWPFTTALSKLYTPEEKKEVLVMVWKIVMADGRLDAHEEHFVRKLHTMLAVNQSVVQEAKEEAAKA